MAEPVSLAQAKQHLRLEPDYGEEDEVIAGIISDARAWVENYTGQRLIAGPITEFLDGFGDRLLAWPVNSVDAVSYIGSDGAETVLAPDLYRAAVGTRPARLALSGAARWPSLRTGAGIVKVEMTAGYADGTVPRGMIRAMLLLISGYYENRDTGGLADTVERAAKAACGPASRGWRL